MKNFLQILLFITFSILSYNYLSISLNYTDEENAIEKKDTLITAAINVVGDLMCHSTQFNYAHVKDDSFDFNGVFSEVKQYLNDADFTIGNFETVLAGKKKGYSGYPYFNAPDDFLLAIKEAGFDLLVNANNHSIDKGAKGVERTIKKMDELGINHTGSYLSQNDRDSIRIFNINGIHLAILAYSYSTNGVPIPKGKQYIINLIDYDLIEKDIAKARNKRVDIVLVYFHFGEEYQRVPNSFQKEVINHTINAGADIIIGSHPHVVQPVDYFKTNNANLDTGFVAYSLGNFISNQRWKYSDAGVIVKINVSKNILSDSVYLSGISYLPTWVFKGKTKKGREYIILPSSKSYDDSLHSYLSKSDKEKMQRAFEDTKYIITKFNSNTDLILP
jgi:poly-gamma-glutamate capsule biosynthesis protein CapA/YwtB (metallophosphatase superfamily)